MGSGKSSLDNSQWRPNKRMAGIPRARDLPASLPRRRLSDRVIRASLAPLASRLARASRRLARRDERPRLRSRAALDRRARSPRSIDDARVDLPRNTIVFQSKKSEHHSLFFGWSRAKRAKFDRPACRERRRRAAEDAAAMVARGATVCVGARCGHASWRARERRTTRCARLRHETTRRRRAC